MKTIKQGHVSKKKAELLAEITPNRQKKCKQRSQTMWACKKCKPIKSYCKQPKCWNAIHARLQEGEIAEKIENKTENK